MGTDQKKLTEGQKITGGTKEINGGTKVITGKPEEINTGTENINRGETISIQEMTAEYVPSYS
jgi:hypothetical protein